MLLQAVRLNDTSLRAGLCFSVFHIILTKTICLPVAFHFTQYPVLTKKKKQEAPQNTVQPDSCDLSELASSLT